MSYGRCLDTKTKLNKIQWSLNLPKPQEESLNSMNGNSLSFEQSVITLPVLSTLIG